MPYIGKSPQFGVRSRFYYTQSSAGGTSVSGTDDNGKTLKFSDGEFVDVMLNGVTLVAGTDYNTSTANTIAGLAALSNGVIVEVVVYDTFSVADTVSAKDGGTFSGAVTANSGLNVGTIKEATGTTTAITIDSSGNVDINGNDLILDADGDTKISASTDDVITFENAGSEAMRIDASGNLLVGTTSTGVLDAAATSDVNVTGSIYVNTTGVPCEINQSTNDTLARTMIRFFRRELAIGTITASPSVVAYNTTSDHRLKENVTADWDATTRLKQLNPVRFNFIVDADNTVDGFLAHEVQSVVPEAITGTHNEVDDDGNPVYQGIDQSKLVPLLVKTIQELEARITALENV